jgi:hypothetical protein
MFKIALQLYVVSFNLSTNEQCLVSLDNEILTPLSVEIGEDNAERIDDMLQKIFETYIDMGFGWTSTKLIHADKNDNIITLTYTCRIPPKTVLKNSYYVSKNISTINNLARKCLYYA